MKRERREFPAERSAIPQVHDFVKDTLQAHGIAGAPNEDLVLACDEAATNIVEHAFKHGIRSMGHRRFILALKCNEHKVTATFFDAGTSFDPERIAAPDVKKNLAGERKGGYGVYLIRKLVDKIVYSARQRLNVTRLIKVV